MLLPKLPIHAEATRNIGQDCISPVAGRRERPVSGSLNAVDASHESAVDVVRRLGKLRLFLYWLAVRIACDIDASEIAPGIDKYVKLNAPTSIAKN